MRRIIIHVTSQHLRHDSRSCVVGDVCFGHSRDEVLLDLWRKVGSFPSFGLSRDPERELSPADCDRADEGAAKDLENHIEKVLLIARSSRAAK